MKRICCILFLCLCKCQSPSYSEKLLERFYDLFDSSNFDYKYLIIIPNSGCSGCITNAETFFIENKERTDVFFVFTRVQSRRELQLRVGEENLNRSNVYIDSNNRLYFKEFEDSVYPVIFSFQDNEIIFDYLHANMVLP